MNADSFNAILMRNKPQNLVPTALASLWSVSGTTRSTGQTDRDGGTGAIRYVETAATSAHFTNITGAAIGLPQAAAFGTHTFSVSAKAGERSWAYLEVVCPVVVRTHFDVTNAVAGTNLLSPFTRIEPEDQGFFRIHMGFNVSDLSGYVFRLGVADADGSTSYLGDITKGLTFWGPMVVRGLKAVPFTPLTVSGSGVLRS